MAVLWVDSMFIWRVVSMRGRSLASSSSSSSVSEVLRLTQEQRSSDAKNAEATLVPTHVARPSSFSYDSMLEFSISDDDSSSIDRSISGKVLAERAFQTEENQSPRREKTKVG